jgi:hypothetical protein
MARITGNCSIGATALVAATAQTMIQMVAPTNQRCAVYQVKVAFDGTNSANTPATVKIARNSTAGTATNTSVAPVKVNEPPGVSETLQLVYQTVFTVEPTLGSIVDTFLVPVFGGLFAQALAPYFNEIMIAGGSRLGFQLTAAQVVNAIVSVWYEE